MILNSVAALGASLYNRSSEPEAEQAAANHDACAGMNYYSDYNKHHNLSGESIESEITMGRNKNSRTGLNPDGSSVLHSEVESKLVSSVAKNYNINSIKMFENENGVVYTISKGLKSTNEFKSEVGTRSHVAVKGSFTKEKSDIEKYMVIFDRNSKHLKPNTIDRHVPWSIPEGSAIILSDYDVSANKTNLSVRGQAVGSPVVMGAGAYIKSENTHEQGNVKIIERVDRRTVRVSVGPYEGLTKAGFAGGLANLMTPAIQGQFNLGIGLKAERRASNLRSAEFDISSFNGLLSYMKFNLTGELPSRNSSGVQNVVSVKYDGLSKSLIVEAGVEVSGENYEGQFNYSASSTLYRRGTQEITNGQCFAKMEMSVSGNNADIEQVTVANQDGHVKRKELAFKFTALTENQARYINEINSAKHGQSEIQFRAGDNAVLIMNEDEMPEVARYLINWRPDRFEDPGRKGHLVQSHEIDSIQRLVSNAFDFTQNDILMDAYSLFRSKGTLIPGEFRKM